MVNLERERLSAEFLVRLSDSRTANRNAAESTHSVIILEPHSQALSALVTKLRPLARYEDMNPVQPIQRASTLSSPNTRWIEVEPLQFKLD